VTAEFADLFSGARVPSWLKRFETEPLLAIDALLVGGADLGFLSADEPTSVLLDWLDMLGEQTDFPQDVDRTLAEWIARYWGHTTLPQAQHSAALTSVAWVRVGELLSVNSTLSTAAAQLRERFIAEPRFLETLHEGRGRDPVGRAWQALARHQTNRDLIGHWWRLCALPVDEPWYRGEYGVWGLRRLPPETPANSGRFSDEAAEGLVRLGVGLSIRAEEGFLDEQTAEREFLRIARLLTVAFPFPNSWEAFWRQERDQKPSSRCLPEKWIRKFVPPRRASKNACPPPRPSKRTRDPQWAHRAGDLAQRLRGNPSDAELDADRLLDEQITYATSTGDTYNLVRTACKLATAIQGQRPELALRWATLAGEFDPWNGYAWTIRASTLHRLRRLPEALAISIEATVRFPDDVVARAGLAEVLKADKRLAEAEQVYRETIERFPDNVVARNGLAEVLKADKRFAEAEKVYQETIERFPDNVVARNGLAEVLKADKRFAEAEKVYQETLERFPDDVVARNGLAEVLKADKRLDEAELVYRETIERFPDDVFARAGLAEVLKADKRLDEAEQVYRETIERFPDNVVARTGLAEVLKADKRLDEAEQVYRETIERFPDDVFARNGLAEVLKADKRLDEAELVYRETIERFPDNVVARAGLAEVLKADKRLDEAEQDHHETIERFPDNVVARAGLAEVLNADKRLAEAELAYRETIERFPDNQRSEKSSNKLPVTPESPSTVVPTTPSTFRRQDATILLTDIYLIRRWARLGGQTGDFNKATSRARDLLVRVTPLIENDAAASYEAGLLEIGLGEWEAAVRLLTEAARRFPGSVRVRFALARAQRAVAQHQSRRLDAASERQVIGPWRQLGKMDPRCRPVQLLGEGRAWLSLQDGSTVTDRARDAFGDLGRWLSKRLKPIHAQPPAYATCLERDRMHFQPLESVEPFVGWWAREVQATLFGSNAVASVDELSDLSPVLSRLKNNAALLDNLEEEGLSRYFSI
jgi:tetratricopeptide (TPR) repeat protein